MSAIINWFEIPVYIHPLGLSFWGEVWLLVAWGVYIRSATIVLFRPLLLFRRPKVTCLENKKTGQKAGFLVCCDG